MKVLILKGVVADGEPQEEGAEIEVSPKDGAILIKAGKAMEIEEPEIIEQPKAKKRGRPKKSEVNTNGS